MNKALLIFGFLVLLFSFRAFAEGEVVTGASQQAQDEITQTEDSPSEIDPFDPNVNQLLEDFDKAYEEQTGTPSHLIDNSFGLSLFASNLCRRMECPIFVQIVKSTQRLYLYREGQLIDTWLVSTGASGHDTPNLDKNPDGRIYNRYSSSKYPGGDYKGLGNMPYAVFIYNGFAIHGTPESNWKYLGKKASHGCIRIHPDNAQYFNRLVREYGVRQVWVTIQD